MRAAHCIAGYFSAIFAFSAAAAVDMLTGRSLKTSVAICRFTAIHAFLFGSIMLVKPVQTGWTAGAELC